MASHHERADGSGYPRRLKGERIGFHGELAGLVDSYCAMIRDRVYGLAISSQKALDQEVKIDQMFVRQAAESEKAREIITSIIQFAGKLKMSVIAEGVETTEILGILSGLGCRYAQGFFFAKALPMAGFIAWWQENQTPG